jgi:hypothetical protein
MVGLTVALLLMLILSPQRPPTGTTDADLWTAALEQVRRDLQVEFHGELVILNETITTAELHPRSYDDIRERRLFDLLRKRNDSARTAIAGIRLSARTRLVEANSVQNWDEFSKRFPGAKLVRLSLPAFSEDGAKSIIYYSATGGPDDSRGGYMVFEKEEKEDRWIVVDYLSTWIT